MRQWHKRREMGRGQVPRDERHDADKAERQKRANRKHHLNAGDGKDAFALNKKADQHQAAAQEKSRVDLQGYADERQRHQHLVPGDDAGIGREKRGEHVTGGKRGANGNHRCPAQPIRPGGDGGEDFAVFQPGHGAGNRGAPGFMREHRADFSIGEHLNTADADRDDPAQPGG